MDQNSNQVTVQISREDHEENTPPNINSSTPDNAIPVRSNIIARNQGIGDRLNNVFREFRPLVEHARAGNNARLSLPSWLPISTVLVSDGNTSSVVQRPMSSVAHVNLGPNSQTYLLGDRPIGITRSTSAQQVLNNSTSIDSQVSDRTADQTDVNISVNPASNNNLSDNNETDNNINEEEALDMCACINLLLQYAPFYTILFLKFIFDCREGLFTFMVLWFTFYHSNFIVKRECGKQAGRSFPALFFELAFTSGTVLLVHFLFGHDRLLPNVVMFPGYTEPIDVWELIWLVSLTDLIVKIITVDFKILVTATPAIVLPYQKRGKVYLFIESISQLYRSLLPIQPWLFYLMQSYSGSEKMTGMFLATVYVIAKVIELFIRLRLFKSATITLLQSVNLGTKPTGEQLTSAGENCPICHDDYSTPVRLGCGHIFCELCICAWLDREHTCPLCRAKVTDEPTWRDGSTTHYFQLY